jgi:branched-chain amino acid transport system ATP-binding protein
MKTLRTESLTKRFLGLVAVNDVSFNLDAGEILGIIGPNGAGKTTFIHLVSGILMPSSGKVFFKDQEVTYMPSHERSRLGIARTFQLIHPLENLTVLENVMIGAVFSRGLSLREAKKSAESICESLQLDGLGRDTASLSILEIKKMEIARALANGPEVLFLDEVMAGLNVDETRQMIAMVKRIAKESGLAVGVVEHVMGVIRELTERVIVLESGELIAEGPYAEVSKNPRVIEAYLGGAA